MSSTPYTLHPIPYTLYPIPYTLPFATINLMPNHKSLHGCIAKLLNRKQYNNIACLAGRQAIQQFNNFKNAYSLFEIVIALFLLGALVTILLTVSGTLFTTRSSRLQQIATKIATKDIEYLRNLSFASLPSTGPCNQPILTDADLTKLPSGDCQRTVTNYLGSSQIKFVTVTVTWQEKIQKRILLDTLVYKYGL